MKRGLYFLFAFALAISGLVHGQTYQKEFEIFHSLGTNTSPEKAGTISYDPTSFRINGPSVKWDDGYRDYFEKNYTDPGIWYTLHLKKNTGYINFSIPACLIVASKFNTKLNVSIDHNGDPWHIALLSNANSCKKSSLDHKLAFKVKTKAEILRKEYRPRPPLIEQRLDKVGASRDQKTFLEKYWLYIFVGLVVFLGNIMTTPGPQAQGTTVRTN